MKNKEEVYPRYCDITGEGMWSGYYVNDNAYIKYDDDLEAYIKKETEYDSVDEAHEDEYYYYTEWEENDIEDEY